jgi:hypothetical protein
VGRQWLKLSDAEIDRREGQRVGAHLPERRATNLRPVPGVAAMSPDPFSSQEPPLLVGEFIARDGAEYVMIVNLSLERSANDG